ncbi:hypothetical protein RA2_04346 [Roseovarius sp. A-2]|uniref:hypothetical protein n=1 Tax=Roseovarius sp. A-2 TaxID=1570360 RepID=UPI0009B55E9B|nr:hypothetical protein [Roseovarius sp. A-2]GAW37269.1 hypothetical protein RA2_04346 [Roseovarius sp. A-2]
MGLDVEFYQRGSEEYVHYLRNHWEFQYLFFDQNPEPAYEGYDDFLVDADVLDRVAVRLARQMIAVGLSRSDVPDTLPEGFCVRRPEVAYAQYLPVYLRIVSDLLAAEAEHGPLICSWSA